MARPGGNPTLRGCGKKGRSGRKSIAVEFNKVKTIKKAWEKVDAEVDKNLNVATQIVLRDMTVKTDITSGGEKINQDISQEDLDKLIDTYERNRAEQKIRQQKII